MWASSSPRSRTRYKTAPEQIAGRAHLGRIDIGLGHHASSQQRRDLEGVDAIVLGLAAVDGFHVQGVAEDEGDLFARAQVGEPVPGEDALDTDDQVFTVRL